jgi:hypothetical protein
MMGLGLELNTCKHSGEESLAAASDVEKRPSV